MNQEEILVMAQRYRIECEGLSKNEIIFKIQEKNGQGNCFATNYGGHCRYIGCHWRNDCHDAANEWLSRFGK